MTRTDEFIPEFCEYIPAQLSPSVLYISIEHCVTKHLCACGCGEPVVLPLHPGHWAITFDGENVTMSPSVGNVGQRCRSHYFIRGGRVVWSFALTERDGSVGGERDRAAVEAATRGMSEKSGQVAFLRRLLRRFRR